MQNKSRGAKQKVICKCCKQEFKARVADIKRGWGKYCSKSCKAIKQEQRTGQMKNYIMRKSFDQDDYFGEYGRALTGSDMSYECDREDK